MFSVEYRYKKKTIIKTILRNIRVHLFKWQYKHIN